MATWTIPYIIVRVGSDGSVTKIHETEKIKDARYWLSYIAQPGDAIFQTPAHPKHDGGESILYKAHLIERGNVGYDADQWSRLVGKKPSDIDGEIA
ncbi:MAG: hypothetical protein IT292_06550 [Deltaproteobacteria bacterium]|nr:hypothetical protein [Deltaproteobacteria bacterium]